MVRDIFAVIKQARPATTIKIGNINDGLLKAGGPTMWNRALKRIGELTKLGTPRYHAILTGLSRKGYWHLVSPGGSDEEDENAVYELRLIKCASCRPRPVRRDGEKRACLHTNIVDWDSPPGYGPVISANHPLRPRMMGGVGRDG